MENRREGQTMANTTRSGKAYALARLLKRINRGGDPKLLRREAHRLLADIGPNDIAVAEQNLIDDGYPVQLVQLLSATFMLMGIPAEQFTDVKRWLPANHLLRTVMVEHDVIRLFLSDLTDVVGALRHLCNLTDVSTEFRRLAHTTEHLDAMRKHFDREDDVIFPLLKQHGRISLCRALEGDHINIRVEIENLARLIVLFNEINPEQFKAGVMRTIRRLQTIVWEHLAQEDEILYPIALGIINDSEFWEQMKAICDEIGYCGIHV
jgi:DUF438 domain-containing protein